MPVRSLPKPLSLALAGEKLAQELCAMRFKDRRKAHDKIFRVETPVKDIDLLSWLYHQKDKIKIYWQDRDGNFELAGVAAAHQIDAYDKETLTKVILKIKKLVSSEFAQSKYFGGIGFNHNLLASSQWKNFGAARFVLPLIEIRKSPKTTMLACNIYTNKNFKKNLNAAIVQLRNLQNIPGALWPKPLEKPLRKINIPDEKEWKSSVKEIIHDIKKNKFQKVVLARLVRLNFQKPVNPFVLMSRLRKNTSNCFCFIFQFGDKHSFIGTSPERLYRRSAQQIETEAVAGTRAKSKTPILGSLLRDELLSSKKDIKEQNFVAQMIKSNLKGLCKNFAADKNPSLLHWSAGQHLITRFEGQLKDTVSDQDILLTIHPTAAVAGTPTNLALKAIRKFESFDRGWYCGPVGYIGLNDSEFAVAIRSGLIRGKDVCLYAGAGIIKESLAASEWDETENKLTNFLDCFYANKK